MIAALLFVYFAVLLVFGAPIAVCLGSSSVLAMHCTLSPRTEQLISRIGRITFSVMTFSSY